MKSKKPFIALSMLVAMFLIASSIFFPLGGVSKVKATATYGNATAADLLSGKTATVDAGQITGTMPNMVTANPNGIGVGRSNALQYWTGGGSDVYFKPQPGYYDGIDTWAKYGEPNLLPANILSGISVFGVAGTAKNKVTANQVYATPGTFSFTVPAGVININTIIIGAGGGGGAAEGVYSNDGRGAGGGSGGAYIGTIPVTPGQVLSVVVGAAGTAGTILQTYGPGTSGSDGGNSSIGSYVAYGGKGGSRAVLCGYGTYGGGAGGSGGGDAGYTGQAGVNGYTPQGPSGQYSNSGYGQLGGQAPGTGGNGGNFGSGSAGANGRVTILW